MVHVPSESATKTQQFTVTDLSRSGMRLEGKFFLGTGTEISVQIKDLVIWGMVRYCVEIRDGVFAAGLLITRVSGEPAGGTNYQTEAGRCTTEDDNMFTVTKKR